MKLDGFRLILTKFEDKVRLYTRHNNEVTSKFSELHQVEIPKGMVLDGQIVVTNKQGKPDFEAMMEMMERYMSRRSHHMVQYCVFDVIYYKGKKVTQLLPLVERKELVGAILKPTEAITKVQWMYGRGTDYFNLIKEQGLEGIVLKKADSKYQINKRSNDWLKVIHYQYADAVVTGSRKEEFGLLLGLEEEGKIKPVGVMEFMNPDARKWLYDSYRDYIHDENTKIIFLESKIKCRVKFRNYTKGGKLRIPSFVEYIS